MGHGENMQFRQVTKKNVQVGRAIVQNLVFCLLAATYLHGVCHAPLAPNFNVEPSGCQRAKLVTREQPNPKTMFNKPSALKLGAGVMEVILFDGGTSSQLAFFQIGGGIAGDFPICVVPMLNQDLQREVPLWSWFCQISESTASYGGYSGAPPNEKITWGKLSVETPKFVIESDATIVAPLIFAYLLDY